MLIIVLGGGIDLKGNIPPHVYQRLDKAIELYKKNPEAKIVPSGKYSYLYRKPAPPSTEAKMMKKYLLEKNIPAKDIIPENQSKDTIGNAYYLKKNVIIPRKEKRMIVVTSSFHLRRTKYIFEKLFEPTYRMEFVGVPESFTKDLSKKVFEHQKELYEKTVALLSPMKRGDHEFLAHKIYNFKYYREKRPDWVVKFVAHGK